MDPNVKQVVLVNLVIIPLDEINIVSIIFPYVPMISTGASSFFPLPASGPRAFPLHLRPEADNGRLRRPTAGDHEGGWMVYFHGKIPI
jgi:hypothetical protein